MAISGGSLMAMLAMKLACAKHEKDRREGLEWRISYQDL